MDSRKRKGRPTLPSTEKKKRKRHRNVSWAGVRQRLSIENKQYARWVRLKEERRLQTNTQVAELVLDSYEMTQSTTVATSTPGPSAITPPLPPDLSEISTAPSTEESGVQKLNSSSPVHSGASASLRSESGECSHPREQDSTLTNPLDVTIQFNVGDSCSSEVSDDSEDGDIGDPDFDPACNISLCPTEALSLPEVSFAETEVGYDVEDDDEPDEEEEDESIHLGPGVKRLYKPEEAHHLTQDETCLVYMQCLLDLAATKVDRNCTQSTCNADVSMQTYAVGSATYIKWICQEGHVIHKWCSQPVLNNGLHGGDLMSAAAILASGNNYAKIRLFARFLRLNFVSSSSFFRIQRCYLVPSVDEQWKEHQEEVLNSLQGKDVTILCDGRMDSPGFCAQYCTFTAMDNEDKKILSILSVDKRETDKKSTIMEREGFIRTMNLLTEEKVKVREVVSDAHSQITALIRKEYPTIKHSHDIWHAAKNLGKKLAAAAQAKNCKSLFQWCEDLITHFWYTCEMANSVDEFMGTWCGILHHVTDEHEWVIPYSSTGKAACNHGPLATTSSRKKTWLKKGDTAHTALRKEVLKKVFLKKVPYWLKFRSTAELENFHQLILMYAAKRYTYTPPVYRARTLLAALDYNFNLNREVMRNTDGSTRYARLFNKKSKRWTSVPLKVPKRYDHIDDLMKRIVCRRLTDKKGMHGKAVLEPSDPRRISRNIASIPPIPTRDLVKEKISRMPKN